MKKTIPYWQMGGFIFTALVGTLLHFVFEWTGGNVIAALFSAVNESIWEHLKLLFYPMVAGACVEFSFWGKNIKPFWCIKLTGIFIGLLLIPVVYYTYTGILGVNVDWINIAIFFLAAGIVYWVETKLFQKDVVCRIHPNVAAVLILGIAVVFTVFTFLPLQIPFFADPVTGNYGFQK